MCRTLGWVVRVVENLDDNLPIFVLSIFPQWLGDQLEITLDIDPTADWRELLQLEQSRIFWYSWKIAGWHVF